MAMSASEFNRRMREAQRKAERELDRVNRANKKAVGDYNRKVDQHNRREIDRVNRENKKAVDDYNRRVDRHNREADRHNWAAPVIRSGRCVSRRFRFDGCIAERTRLGAGSRARSAGGGGCTRPSSRRSRPVRAVASRSC